MKLSEILQKRALEIRIWGLKSTYIPQKRYDVKDWGRFFEIGVFCVITDFLFKKSVIKSAKPYCYCVFDQLISMTDFMFQKSVLH